MTIAHWLSDCHNVRDNILRFECPIMCTNSTKSNLHFIRNKYAAMLTNYSANDFVNENNIN